MQNINYTTNNIEANTKKSDALLNEMKKKERLVNVFLYIFVAIMLASDGVAGWLFHKNKK